MSEKKVGRPPLSDDKRRRHNQVCRLRTALRENLSDAAARNQRSVSEEIEYRLERSFEHDATTARLDRIERMLMALQPQLLPHSHDVHGVPSVAAAHFPWVTDYLP